MGDEADLRARALLLLARRSIDTDSNANHVAMQGKDVSLRIISTPTKPYTDTCRKTKSRYRAAFKAFTEMLQTSPKNVLEFVTSPQFLGKGWGLREVLTDSKSSTTKRLK